MVPNRGSHKQGKVPNPASFAEVEQSGASAPYLLRHQRPSAPALSMFSSYSNTTSQYPPGLDMGDVPGLQSSKAQPSTPTSYHGSSYYIPGQTPVSNQQSQSQTLPQKLGELSDVEKLRKLKEAILAGQHPFFRADPKPDVLASLWLGPHPASQTQKAQNAKPQAEQAMPIAPSEPDSKPSLPIEKTVSEPQTVPVDKPVDQASSAANATGPSTTLGPSTAQHVTSKASNETPSSGVESSRSEGLPTKPDVTISSKPQETLLPNGPTPAVATPTHTQPNPSTPTQPTTAPGTSPDQNLTLPPSGTAPPLRESPVASKPAVQTVEYKDSAAYRASYDRDRSYERDRERDRVPYPYDSRYDPRYTYPPDYRRDSSRDGRYPPRYSDPRYEREREWGRREWEERERERERDRARERYDYERSSRPPVDRRPPPPTHGATPHYPPLVDMQPRPAAPADAPVPPVARADVPPPERRPSVVPPHPEQRPQGAQSVLEPPHPDLPRRPEPELTPAHSDRYPEQAAPHSQSQPPTERAPSSGQLPRPEATSIPSVAAPEGRASSVTIERPPTATSIASSSNEHAPRPSAPPVATEPPASRAASEARPRTPVVAEARVSYPSREESDAARSYYPSDHGVPPRPVPPATISPRRPAEPVYEGPQERRHSSTSYREPVPPPPSASARPYSEGPSRPPPVDTSIPRRTDSYYPPVPSPTVDRREEIRQWRKRESYPPFDERERVRRYSETHAHRSDAVKSSRPPPASWDRERPTHGPEYEPGWERKHPTAPPTRPPPPPARWEDPLAPRPPAPPYDDRFIPRDAARYPPAHPSPAPPEAYRENPRVRQRSPSTTAYDDAHRATKRVRDDYDRPPYFEDHRRAEYPPRVASPAHTHSSYYDPREPPYARERPPPDPYRRDMPPPPAYYPPRDRYPPPR